MFSTVSIDICLPVSTQGCFENRFCPVPIQKVLWHRTVGVWTTGRPSPESRRPERGTSPLSSCRDSWFLPPFTRSGSSVPWMIHLFCRTFEYPYFYSRYLSRRRHRVFDLRPCRYTLTRRRVLSYTPGFSVVWSLSSFDWSLTSRHISFHPTAPSEPKFKTLSSLFLPVP